MKFRNWIISCISLILGALLPEIFNLSMGQKFVWYGVVLVYLLIMLGLYYLRQYYIKRKRVVYTVMIYLLNDENKLYIIPHQFHNYQKYMVPCGSVPSNMTPNEAVVHFLNRDAGLNSMEYQVMNIRELGDGYIRYSDAQIEFITKHRKNVAVHYAFNYYLRLTAKDKMTNEHFKSYEEISGYSETERPFSDVIYRYKWLLENVGENCAK